MEREEHYTRLKYFGFGNDREWYIKEPFVPGVRQCVPGELILNLPTRPNLVQMFPNSAFLERNGQEFKVIGDKKTIDDVLSQFQK